MSQPSRYGSNYDASVGDNGAETLPDGMVARLDANPDVTSLTLFAGSQARVGDKTIPILGLESVRGNGQPTMLEGRLPSSDDEIALGRLTARDIDAHIGDAVELAGATQTKDFRVTGLAVVPGLGANDGLGAGGIVTMSGLTRIDSKALITSAAVNFRVSLQKFFSSIPEFADLPPEPRVQARFHRQRLAGSSDTVRARCCSGRSCSAHRGPRDVDIAAQSTPGSRDPSVARCRPQLDHQGRSMAGDCSHGAARDDRCATRHRGGSSDLRRVRRQHGRGGRCGDSRALTIGVGAVAVVAVANGLAALVSRQTRRREPAVLLQGE